MEEKNGVSCGKCLDVCSAICNLRTFHCGHTYVAYAKERNAAYQSASGRVAYFLSKLGIEKGFTIVGAVWDFVRGVKHTCIQDKVGLDKLRKSKNVQSYVSEAFQAICENEKLVIIGLPCQIQGFYNIYGDRENILYVEMDCMGPAGKNLFDKYVDYLNNINSSGIEDILMKDKTKSWLTYGVRVKFKDGTEYYADKYKDPFCQCFNFAHTIQDTCLKYCRWKKVGCRHSNRRCMGLCRKISI